MLSRSASFFVALLFITLAAATQTVTYAPSSTPPPASQCNTDHLYCCNNVEQANNSVIVGLLALINVVVSPITALVGSDCSSINVAGIGSGGACTAQPVCCQNNHFEGVVVIGCTPVTIIL
ncbi:hydrophobin [Panaeolus papilionaceus]|nr:hydrophobin [Panaeolus papilionaceus]